MPLANIIKSHAAKSSGVMIMRKKARIAARIGNTWTFEHEGGADMGTKETFDVTLIPADKVIKNEDKPTQKQLDYIADMQEFSSYSLPKFTGTTKKEANEYIDKWRELAHEDTSSPMFGY